MAVKYPYFMIKRKKLINDNGQKIALTCPCPGAALGQGRATPAPGQEI